MAHKFVMLSKDPPTSKASKETVTTKPPIFDLNILR